MPSYPSPSLPPSPRLPPLSFLPLPLPSPPLSDSKPPPLSPSTESPSPPSSYITTFLSTLLNLTKCSRSRPPSLPPISPPLHSPSSLYPGLMKSLSLSGRPDLALLLSLSLPSPPSPPLLSSFLHSLYLLRQPHLLHSSLSSLFPLFHLPLSPATSTILLTSLSNLSNSPESAYSAFLSIRNPDAVAFGALIAMLCRAGRSEEALGVFDLMLERGVRPTARTCTCILKMYCLEGRMREAERFLWAMENGIGSGNGTANGVLPRPDVIMYTVYIQGLCLVRDFDSVEQVMSWYGTSRAICPN